MSGLSDIEDDHVTIQQIQNRPKQNGVRSGEMDVDSTKADPQFLEQSRANAEHNLRKNKFLAEYNNTTGNGYGRLKTFDVNKYISETNTTFTEEEIKRLISDQTRSGKSSAIQRSKSGQSAKIWDELEDIDDFKTRRSNSGEARGTDEMTAVGPMTPKEGKPEPKRGESIHDLVPAGLIKATDNIAIVEPKYTTLGESIRYNAPNEMQCSMFCGGRRCKYESGNSWDTRDMAIKGIYSHWITDDILAMARPNTSQMEKHNVIEQFNRAGVKSVINLQMPGEHASCGPKLEPSGFTYEPNELMKHKIFYYNFVWRDFGETSMTNLLDMVKVLSFALSEGKVAVHCHAGLGRTGVLLACYLVYYLRVRSNDAIRYVRLKRPNAVQTRRQIGNVKEFETFFLPQCLVFSSKPPSDKDRKLGRFTVETALKRQKFVVHGFEARALKYIPKILYVICERIIRLCDEGNYGYNVNTSNFTHSFLIHKLTNNNQQRLFSNPGSTESTPNDSIAVTRRSSQSMLLGEDEVTTTTTTPGDTRPSSETNSLVQSCSSALSGVDDKKLDEILGDGIKGQTLAENKVTRELASHLDIQSTALQEKLPIYSTEAVYKGIMELQTNIQNGKTSNDKEKESKSKWSDTGRLQVKSYQVDLNFKVSAWDRLNTETSITVLSTLLFEWLEHLKTPLLDRDTITYIVILSENVEKAFKRLPTHQGYILEYMIRFVARLQPLEKTKAENLMKRLLASLTQQSIPIEGTLQPVGKNFTKLRGGTMSSCLKFMMTIYDLIVEKEGYATAGKELSKSQKMREILGGFKSVNPNANNKQEEQ